MQKLTWQEWLKALRFSLFAYSVAIVVIIGLCFKVVFNDSAVSLFFRLFYLMFFLALLATAVWFIIYDVRHTKRCEKCGQVAIIDMGACPYCRTKIKI